MTQSSPRKSADGPLASRESWWDGIFEAADLQNLGPDSLDRTLLSPPGKAVAVGGFSVPLEDKVESGSSLPYPSKQKIAAAKFSLNYGKAHFTISGKLRKARHLKNPCHIRCNRCDLPRLSSSERIEIFDTFWSLGNHERQWCFIFGCIKSIPPIRKLASPRSRRERHYSHLYHFLLSGKARKVCKTMFKNTLCICDSWINNALSHFSNEGFTPDLRGKTGKSVK